MSPVKLFISYVHKDRQRWLAPVHEHLRSVQNIGAVHVYEDSQLRPGQEWDPELKRRLDEADIVVLIVTPAFLASAYCTSIEVARAMDRHKDGTARVVPILADHRNWSCMPFRILEMVPKDENEQLLPLVDWPNINKPLARIAQRIEALAREIGARKAAVATPVTTGRLPDLAWNFTGREAELARLREQLHRRPQRHHRPRRHRQVPTRPGLRPPAPGGVRPRPLASGRGAGGPGGGLYGARPCPRPRSRHLRSGSPDRRDPRSPRQPRAVPPHLRQRAGPGRAAAVPAPWQGPRADHLARAPLAGHGPAA